ncbi:MAG: hypothetical protein ACI4PG_06575 [Candidatus Ventricola sp.]
MEDENKDVQKNEGPAEESPFRRGVLKLKTPIRAGGQDVTELCYDFTRLTGMEYVEAMDMDEDALNVMRVTYKQALCLFAQAAGKATPGIDATDIRSRMGVTDAAHAVRLATVFLVASQREEKRSSSAA